MILSCVSTLYAMPYKGRVLDINAIPIIGATASVISEDSTILSMSVTDTLGYYTLDLENFPATIRAKTIRVPNAQPPSSIFICCHFVSSFSTG